MKTVEQIAPGRVTPANADYPHGSAKNSSTPKAKDGTPIDEQMVNNTQGFYQALLQEAGITPDGKVETAKESQLLNAVKKIAEEASSPSGWGETDAYAVADANESPTTWNKGIMGVFKFDENTANKPDSKVGTGLLTRYSPSDTQSVFAVIFMPNDGGMMFRTYDPNFSTSLKWSDWSEVATSSELKNNVSALETKIDSKNAFITGQINKLARGVDTTGWLEANGDSVSRTTYADLFAVIGTNYGEGDGSTTFNLPDERDNPQYGNPQYTTYGNYPGTYPRGIAVDSDGTIYVADYDTDKIYRKLKNSNNYEIYGNYPGTYPIGIAVDSDSTVYVADYDTNKIYRKLKNSNNYEIYGNYPGTHLWDIAVDSSGNVYVTDANTDEIYRKLKNSNNYETYGNYSGTHPRGIAVDSSGNVYVDDYDTDKVYKKLKNSNNYEIYGNYPGSYPVSIAVDSEGSVYVGDRDTQKVYRKLKKSNNYEIYGDYPGAYSLGISVDSEGTVYVTDYHTHEIYRKLKNSSNYIKT